MIIVMAGNFPMMKDPKWEGESCEKVQSTGLIYARLVSFHFKEDTQTLMDMKRGCYNADKAKKRKRRNSSGSGNL